MYQMNFLMVHEANLIDKLTEGMLRRLVLLKVKKKDYLKKKIGLKFLPTTIK